MRLGRLLWLLAVLKLKPETNVSRLRVMSAFSDTNGRLKLRERRSDEVLTPRPLAGGPKQLLKIALDDTCAEHGETLRRLGEV